MPIRFCRQRKEMATDGKLTSICPNWIPVNTGSKAVNNNFKILSILYSHNSRHTFWVQFFKQKPSMKLGSEESSKTQVLPWYAEGGQIHIKLIIFSNHFRFQGYQEGEVDTICSLLLQIHCVYLIITQTWINRAVSLSKQDIRATTCYLLCWNKCRI